MDKVDEILLEHFGVKGMHWGIRNEKRQVRREARAKKFDTKARDIQSEIDKTRPFRKRKIANLQEDKARALDNAQRKREGKLSKGQRKLL